MVHDAPGKFTLAKGTAVRYFLISEVLTDSMLRDFIPQKAPATVVHRGLGIRYRAWSVVIPATRFRFGFCFILT